MGFLFELDTPVVVALVVSFYIAAGGQLLHVLFLSTRRDARPFSLVKLYEVLLFVHLLLAAGTANSVHSGYGVALFRLKAFSFPVESLLWIDAAAALLGLALAIAYRRPIMTSEIALMALITPPSIDMLGHLVPYLLIGDAAFFVFRVGTVLTFDVRAGRRSVSRLSIIDSIRALPEGVICTDDEGSTLFMNESMRSCLTALGLANDLADTRGVWGNLEEAASKAEGGADAVLPEGIRLEISPDETRLFVRDRVRLGRKEYRRMVAFDVTEEESINSDIERMNHFLDVANTELVAAVENAREVSRNEAILRMRSRVHDTVGQRLSILHRYLEDDDPDPEKLARVVELARTVVEDLAESDDIDAEGALRAIESSFFLVGIVVSVEGELPANPDVALAFVDVVREAATNAAKHGHAHRVDVRLAESGGFYKLNVRNDGAAARGEVREGTGFPSMRRVLARVDGTLSIASTSPFTIEAQAPCAPPHEGEDQ